MVRAALPNPRDLLRPGMSFAVELTVPGEDYATVPELALQWGKGESFVWCVDADNKAKRVVVRSVKRLNRVILVAFRTIGAAIAAATTAGDTLASPAISWRATLWWSRASSAGGRDARSATRCPTRRPGHDLSGR